MRDLVAGIFGARDQGKTTLARMMLRQLAPPRCLLFDPMGQFDAKLAATLIELKALAGRPRFALRYAPPIDHAMEKRFNAFCALALALGDLVLVVDELQLVTKPAYSPPAWKKAVLIGRHRAVRIIATSQRPAMVDATFRSNCSLVAAFRVNFHEDVRTLANMLGVAPERIQGLRRFGYLVRDMATGQVTADSTRAGRRK